MKYFDAHNHLQDARLAQGRSEWMPALEELPIAGAVVNGTRQRDWKAVESFAAEFPWVTPSFGLHPWCVRSRTEGWLDDLREHLQRNPAAGVGEIGLDRWIQDHDIEDQQRVFLPQLRLAAELNRPATIHCLQAWGALWDIIRSEPASQRGFLIHAYGGPAEMVGGFAECGAYFSFNAYYLRPRKLSQREVFQHISLERLLVETDAPDMSPPDEQNPRSWKDRKGNSINHPANIDLAYRALGELRGLDVETLAHQVEENYRRLFRSRD